MIIYAIFNIVNDKCYVGQTTDKQNRFQEHEKQLRGFYHHSLPLQRAWCKYGEQNFIFVILERLNNASLEELTIREQWWMDRLGSEYNIAPAAGSMKGYKHTEEARQKMSNAHKGKKQHSDEYKKKLSERMKGNSWNKGRKLSAKHIEALALSTRGKPKSIEHKAKIAAGNKGKLISRETCIKQSIAARNRRERERKELVNSLLTEVKI